MFGDQGLVGIKGLPPHPKGEDRAAVDAGGRAIGQRLVPETRGTRGSVLFIVGHLAAAIDSVLQCEL